MSIQPADNSDLSQVLTLKNTLSRERGSKNSSMNFKEHITTPLDNTQSKEIVAHTASVNSNPFQAMQGTNDRWSNMNDDYWPGYLDYNKQSPAFQSQHQPNLKSEVNILSKTTMDIS